MKKVDEQSPDWDLTQVVHTPDTLPEEQEQGYHTSLADPLGTRRLGSQADMLQRQVVGMLVDKEVGTSCFLETWGVVLVVEVVIVALLRELGNAGVSLFQPFL